MKPRFYTITAVLSDREATINIFRDKSKAEEYAVNYWNNLKKDDVRKRGRLEVRAYYDNEDYVIELTRGKESERRRI